MTYFALSFNKRDRLPANASHKIRHQYPAISFLSGLNDDHLLRMLFLATGRYQLAFTTPGISPQSAISRKQIRQRPNFLKKPRGRPHLRQRLYPRTLNFGLRPALAIRHFFATLSSSRATHSHKLVLTNLFPETRCFE